MAFVDYDVPIFAHPVVDNALAHEALHKRNIDHAAGFLSAASHITNCRLRQIKKSAKPLDPLLEQLASMHQHQCIDAAFCNQPRSNDGFSESRAGG